jgi:hypothetical protein
MLEFQASNNEPPRLPAGRDTSFNNDKRNPIFYLILEVFSRLPNSSPIAFILV